MYSLLIQDHCIIRARNLENLQDQISRHSLISKKQMIHCSNFNHYNPQIYLWKHCAKFALEHQTSRIMVFKDQTFDRATTQEMQLFTQKLLQGLRV